MARDLCRQARVACFWVSSLIGSKHGLWAEDWNRLGGAKLSGFGAFVNFASDGQGLSD